MPPGQAWIYTNKVQDPRDTIYCQEKLDGSCCAVAKVDDKIVPLGRAGYPAITSPFEFHHLFHDWAMERSALFVSILGNGERIIGEWLALAHGTRYVLGDLDPWVPFDMMRGTTRSPIKDLVSRINGVFCDRLISEYLIGPVQPEVALEHFQAQNRWGAIDPIEGVVYRAERSGEVISLAKWVRPDKIDGRYLPEITGKEPIWNWRPPSI